MNGERKGFFIIGLISFFVMAIGMIESGESFAPFAPLFLIIATIIMLVVPLYIIEAIGAPGGKLHNIKLVRIISGFISYIRGMGIGSRILQLVVLWAIFFVVSAFFTRWGVWTWIVDVIKTTISIYTIISVSLMISDLFIWMGLVSFVKSIIGKKDSQDRHGRGTKDVTAEILASKLDKESD